MSWYTSPTAIALSFWGTAIGVLVGMVGFYITIRQIRQVKSTTEAAETAISELKVRFSHFDVIEECTIAENALSSLKEIARSGDWSESLFVCDKLATSLINLLERFPFDLETSAQLREAKARATSLSLLADRDKAPPPNPAKDMAALREIHSVLMKVRFKVQEDQ